MKRIKLSNGLHFIMILLFASNLFLLTSSLSLRNIGRYALSLSFLFILLGVIYYYIIKRKLNFNLMSLCVFVILFLVFQLINMLIHSDYNFELLIKVTLIFSFIIISSQLRWSKYHFIMTGIFISLAIIGLFVDWSLADHTVSFRSIFRNPNGLAIVLFTSLYFQWLSIKYTKLKSLKIYLISISLVTVFLIIQTASRAVYIALLVVLGIMLIQHFKPIMVKYLMPLVFTFIFIFMVLYIKVFTSPWGLYLNELSRNLFGKSLYSGRESLWIEIWDKIKQAPILGYGISKTSINITTLQLSTHNQYLQTLLEVGLVGLLIFLVIFYILNRLLVINLNEWESKLSFSFFIAFIVYSTFELTLFQNNFPLSLIQWTVITTGIYIPTKIKVGFPFSLSIGK